MSAPAVAITPAQCHEIIARVNRHAAYSPGRELLTAEQDLLAACNTIISQQQALLLLNTHLDDLEREVTTMRNQMTAVEDELAEARAELRSVVEAGLR